MHDVLWLEYFHFIRPAWLLLIPVVGLIHWQYQRIYSSNARWKKIIAPHLLDHLNVSSKKRLKIRPYQSLTVILTLMVLVAAGPTWQKQITPFTEDRAPLVIALELTPSMMAMDQPPTRLARAKQKIKDLLDRRQGAKTALIVYAGSAHVALPLTDDAELITLYLDSLVPSLMPREGNRLEAVFSLAKTMFAKETVAGSLLIVTDGVNESIQPALEGFHEATKAQTLIYGFGTEAGGLAQDEQGRMTDRQVSGVDFAAANSVLKTVQGDLIQVTLDQSDTDQLMASVRSHLVDALDEDSNLRWQDGGYPLVWLIAGLGLVWFRKGWTLL